MKFPEIQTFNIEPDAKRQALKVLEETAEFVEAAKQYIESDHTFEFYLRMTDEAADVYMALANALTLFHVSDEGFAEAVEMCEQRNRERGRYDLAKELNHE